ncbi:MAG: cyclic nucleotide-binding domain-containing protein [Planctomycetes bacterium]|nr:cyclic nucleotide-binding domain-containing protein [Planctomycetota bacterium]
MTVELPGVVANRCHAVCAASLHQFLMLHEMRKGAVDGKQYTCSWTNCRATMEIAVGAEFPELKPGAPSTAASQPPQVAAPAAPAAPPVAPANPASALLSKMKGSNPMAAFLSSAGSRKDEEPTVEIPAMAAAPAAAAAPPAPGAVPVSDDKSKSRVVAIASRLKTAPIFQGLPGDELERVANAVKLLSFPAGTILLKSGDPGERYYLLAAGKVDVFQVDQDGTEKVLSSLGIGQGVGEMSLLTGEKCSATVRAVEAVQALVINRSEFETMLEAAPQLNRHFNKILADRLRSTNQKLTDVIQNGVLGKLSMFSLPELTQALAVSGRTGYLHLTHKSQRGYLTVRDGYVFGAKLPGQAKPEDAFLAMVIWREGEFRFEQGDISTLGLRPIDTTSLIMEGARRADEKARGAEAPKPAEPAKPA